MPPKILANWNELELSLFQGNGIHFFQLNVNLSFFQENGTFSTCLRFCQMSSVSTDISVTKIAVKIKRVQIEAIDVYSDSLILTPNSISRYSPFWYYNHKYEFGVQFTTDELNHNWFSICLKLLVLWYAWSRLKHLWYKTSIVRISDKIENLH